MKKQFLGDWKNILVSSGVILILIILYITIFTTGIKEEIQNINTIEKNISITETQKNKTLEDQIITLMYNNTNVVDILLVNCPDDCNKINLLQKMNYAITGTENKNIFLIAFLKSTASQDEKINIFSQSASQYLIDITTKKIWYISPFAGSQDCIQNCTEKESGNIENNIQTTLSSEAMMAVKELYNEINLTFSNSHQLENYFITSVDNDSNQPGSISTTIMGKINGTRLSFYEGNSEEISCRVITEFGFPQELLEEYGITCYNSGTDYTIPRKTLDYFNQIKHILH